MAEYKPTGDPRVDKPAQANIAQFKKYKEASTPTYVKSDPNYGKSQKQIALEKGGNYEEGGQVYQVQAPRIQQQAVKERQEEKLREERQTSTSKYGWDEQGEVYAPPLKKEKQVVSRSDFLSGTLNDYSTKSNLIKPTELSFVGPQQPETSFIHPGLLASEQPQQQKPNLKGVIKQQEQSSPLSILKPISDPIKAGLSDIGLQLQSIGVAVEADIKKPGTGTEKAEKFIEQRKAPPYPPYSPQDILRKGASIYGFAAIAGAGDAAVGAGAGIAKTISRGLEIGKAEKFLSKIEPGIVRGREKVGPNEILISSGTEGRSGTTSKLIEPTLVLTKKGHIAKATYTKVPKKVVIPEKGKPAKIPYLRVKFGEKGGTTIEPVVPIQKTPPLTPSTIDIRGKLDPTTQKLLGTKQTGPFTYKVEPTTPQGRRTYQKGMFESNIKPIAEGQIFKLKELGTSKFHKEFMTPQGKRTVYAETKAEKITFPKNEPVLNKITKPSTPFDISPSKPSTSGAGASGKAKVFSTQESKAVKEMITRGQKQTPKQSSVFVTPSALIPGMYGYQEQVIQYPAGTKEKFIDVFANPRQTPSQRGLNTSQRGLNPQIITPRTTQPVVQVPIQKTPTTQLNPPIQKQPPVQIITPTVKLIPPTKQTTTLIQPPFNPIIPKVPIEPPFRPRLPILPLRLGDSHGGSAGRSYPGDRFNFVGNTPEDQIEGLFKGFTIKYASSPDTSPRLPRIKPEKKESRTQRFFNRGIGYNTPNTSSLTSSSKKSKPSSKGMSFFNSGKKKSKGLGFSSKSKVKFF